MMHKASSGPVLAADCVTKWYGQRQVLACASLEANSGEIRLLLGRNGSGKSTLMKIACGVLQPTSGTVRLRGRVLERATLPYLARRGVLFLPDRSLLSGRFTVREHIRLFARRFGTNLDIALPGGDFTLDQPVETMSSGQRRRAELALALARQPDCLIADEPIRSLGPIDAASVCEALNELAHRGCAVVVSGHEVPDLLAIATRVVWCTSGTTYDLGTPVEARAHEAFLRDYLGQSLL